MSALQKSLLRNKIPPKCPRTSGITKLAPFGNRRKDYTPVCWKQYFHECQDVETEGGVFRVYKSKEPAHHQNPRIITLHGGGYSGLSWALFTEEITNMIHCQVVSMDIRGHGVTKAQDEDDLSADTLVKDIDQVLHKIFGDEIPPLILVGHSMGGAIAVRAAHLPSLEPYVQGLAVIDVVEGTAMDALASMQSFLRSRPTHFKSIEHAIEWCVRSGQVRNVDSARVSMPGQIVNCQTNQLGIYEVEGYRGSQGGDIPHCLPQKLPRSPPPDAIAEEGEETKEESIEFARPAELGDCDTKLSYRWRINLSRTELHWPGWFRGLSSLFLSTQAPRLLLLASIDGLDRELITGQMQGKFQMQVLTRCGHAVHEDNPTEVARVIACFALRHRLTTATEAGEEMHLVSVPGC